VILLLILNVLIIVPAWSQKSELKVYREQDGESGYAFLADNPSLIPAYCTIDFPQLTNMQSSEPLPFSILLAPGATRTPLLKLSALVPDASFGFKMSYSWVKGNPDAVHDPAAVYLFPFAHGTKWGVTQGNHGASTHKGDNEYAFDFNTPIGTPIHAARGGIVAEVKIDSNRGGPEPEYNDYGNFILVYHPDGSFANYVHLKLNGSVVKVGDTVEAGQLIGYSGNTGRSSGPHLHFDVRLATRDGGMSSIPVSFLSTEGVAIIPQEGEFYYATHPGKPAFPMVFGKNLSNADYADYKMPSQATGKVLIRAEQLDLTYILFLQNGADKPMDVQYNLKLDNYTSSNKNPGSVIVPARTEVFLTILQIIHIDKASGYDFSTSFRTID